MYQRIINETKCTLRNGLKPDWFILVRARITKSRHQMEIKLYEHHFYKADWEELDISTDSIQRKLIKAA